jgi:hypothetical protein
MNIMDNNEKNKSELTYAENLQIETELICSGAAISNFDSDENQTESPQINEIMRKLLSGEEVLIDYDLEVGNTKKENPNKSLLFHYDRFLEENCEPIRKAIVKSARKEIKKNNSPSFAKLLSFDVHQRCGQNCTGSIRRTEPSSNLLLNCPICDKEITPINEYDSSLEFHQTAKDALDVLIRTCVTDVMSEHGQYRVIKGPNKMLGKKIRYGKSASKLREKNSMIKHNLEIASSIRVDGKPIQLINDKDEVIEIEIPTDKKGGGRRYFGLALQAVDRLSKRLISEDSKSIRILKDEDWVDEEIDSETWGKRLACQIFYAIEANLGTSIYEKTTPRLAVSGRYPSNSNLIILSNELCDKLDEVFSLNGKLVGKRRNQLTEFFEESLVPPMYCEPENWILDENSPVQSKGGFKTNRMNRKYPMISDEKFYSNIGIKRFSPSNKAVGALNDMQRTRWTIDERMIPVIKATILKEINERVKSRILIRNEKEEDWLPQRKIQLKGKGLDDKQIEIKLKKEINSREESLRSDLLASELSTVPDASTIEQWLRMLEHAEKISNNNELNQTFYHSWRFDWRGRCITSTNMLSPQGDDISRGLLRFRDSRQLDEAGWKWLQALTALIWHGRDIEGVAENKDHISLLNSANNEQFQNTLRSVILNPMDKENYNKWANNDILRSKAEGFRRLAITNAFIDALDEGGVGANCNLPLVQDASTNVYQHVSMLMRDPIMAKAVNVLPNETNKPADIYSKVAKLVKADWNENPPFINFEIPEVIQQKIQNAFTQRSATKKPVMTIAYGAGKLTMIDQLLSHNGNSRKDKGKMPLLDANAEDDSSKRTFFAHPSSMLAGLMNDEVDPKYHFEIAEKIINSIKSAIKEILPGFDTAKKELSKLVSISNKMGNTLEWTLPDGSKINNFQSKISVTKTYPRWIFHRDATDSDTLDVLDEISSEVREYFSNNLSFTDEQLNRIFILDENENRIIDWTEYSLNLLGEDITHQRNKRLTSKAKQMINEKHDDVVLNMTLRLEKAYHTSHFSIFSRNSDYAEKKAITAVAPNFVHSIDGAHMRAVCRDVSKYQNEKGNPNQFWAVHDAFGVHPNDLEFMRKSIIKNFVGIHAGKDGNGLLHDLMVEITGEGLNFKGQKLELNDVGKMTDDGAPESFYFVY